MIVKVVVMGDEKCDIYVKCSLNTKKQCVCLCVFCVCEEGDEETEKQSRAVC